MTALSWLRECTPQLRRTWMFHTALFSDLLSAMPSSLTPFFHQTTELKWGFSSSPAVSQEGFATWLCSGASEGCLNFPAAASLLCLSSVLLVFICVYSLHVAPTTIFSVLSVKLCLFALILVF